MSQTNHVQVEYGIGTDRRDIVHQLMAWLEPCKQLSHFENLQAVEITIPIEGRWLKRATNHLCTQGKHVDVQMMLTRFLPKTVRYYQLNLVLRNRPSMQNAKKQITWVMSRPRFTRIMQNLPMLEGIGIRTEYGGGPQPRWTEAEEHNITTVWSSFPVIVGKRKFVAQK